MTGGSVLRRALDRMTRAVRLARWKLRVRPRDSLIAQVKARKQARLAAGVAHRDAPNVSIVVQSFNQVRNVPLLHERLRRTCAEELIVCEDGSIDGSTQAWLERLDGPNDFLIRANDIHEIRAYGRAVDLARGAIVCLMQDDDRPPADGAWLARAADLFARYPKLAVLGGWCGFNQYFSEEYNAPWLPEEATRIPFADPASGEPFMFVENVNIGPYLLRKEAYREVGGFDLAFSEPGAPGITFESEICYRLWKAGWQVGLTDIPVKVGLRGDTYILPGGTLLWGSEARQRNEGLNKQRIVDLHGGELPLVQARVRRANAALAVRAHGAVAESRVA